MNRSVKGRGPTAGRSRHEIQASKESGSAVRTRSVIRSWAAIALGAVLAGFVLAACGSSETTSGTTSGEVKSEGSTTVASVEEGSPGGTLNMLATNPIGSADASTAFSQQAYVLERPTYVGLTALPAKGGEEGTEPVAGVATTDPTPSDGGKTWTFTLRKGLKFSNGEEFTPQDVPYSIKRIFVLGGGPAYNLGDLVDAEACAEDPKTCDLSKSVEVDEKNWTVTFHLKAPNGFFPEKLSLIYMVPSSTPMKIQSFTPALGPYMWKTNNNQESVLVRNPEYKEGTFEPDLFPVANPDEIVQKYGVTPQQEATEVINGQADYMWDEVPPDQLNELVEKSPSQVKVNPSPFVDYAFLNTKVPPFNNLKAREAINFAANRAAYVNAVGGSRVASVSCQVVPASVNGYEQFCPWTANPAPNGEGEWSAPDLTKAKQLVKESGTEGESVQAVVPNNEKALGEQLVDDLNSIGYKAELKLLTPQAAYGFQQNSANEPQTGISFWQSSVSGGLVFVNLLSCNSFHPNSDASPNLAEYCNKEVDAKIASAERTAVTNLDKAYEEVAEVDKMLTTQAPWLTLYNVNDVDIVSARVKNYVYSPLSQFLPDVASVE